MSRVVEKLSSETLARPASLTLDAETTTHSASRPEGLLRAGVVVLEAAVRGDVEVGKKGVYSIRLTAE